MQHDYLEIVIRYFHFIGIMCLTALLIARVLLAQPQVPSERLRLLSYIDGAYGISAVIVLLTGLSLWLWLGKPEAFYYINWVFHLKFSIFIVIALLSIYPTLFFIQNRRSQATVVAIPPAVLILMRIELALLLPIPLLAILMARGIGIT